MRVSVRVLLVFSFSLLFLLSSMSLMQVQATLGSEPPCVIRHHEQICHEHESWIVTFVVAQGSGQICWSVGTRGGCTSSHRQALFRDGDIVTITGQGASFSRWQLSCPSYYQLDCATGSSTVNPLRLWVPFPGLIQGYFS